MSLKLRVLNGEILTPDLLNQLYLELDSDDIKTTFELMKNQKTIDGITSYEVIADILPKNKKIDILDLGCGQGEVADFLNPIYINTYTGVDISTQEIWNAKNKKFNFSTYFEERNANNLSFLPNSFHFVVSHMFLHMCNDLVGVTTSAYKVLIPGGAFISITRDYLSENSIIKKLRIPTMELINSKYPKYKLEFKNPVFSDLEMANLLFKKIGFKIKTIDFNLYQMGDPKLVIDMILGMYPACLLKTDEQSELRNILSKEIKAYAREELVYPMKMIVLEK